MGVAGPPGGRFTIQKFYNSLRSQGIRVGKDTLPAYLDHLQDAFLIRVLEVDFFATRSGDAPLLVQVSLDTAEARLHWTGTLDMHVHASDHPLMRTTIELRDDQRARLLELAARRGEKGFSRLIQEAVDSYLEREARRDRSLEGAMSAIGSLPDESADELERVARQLRKNWR